MATVTGLTAEKADEIHDQSLVSATVEPSTGRLLFTRMDGAVVDAGVVRGSTPLKWDKAWTYKGGDLVFYAGRAYRASNTNLNKVPAFEQNDWVLLSGASSSDVVETDPTFERSSYTDQWETFWKTGSPSPTVSYTSAAGEFETGRRALKIFLPPSTSQRLYQKEENLVTGGDLIILRVRAKKLAASTGVQLNPTLIQNDATGSPEPLASGAVYVSADIPPAPLTTSWKTYEFRFVAANAKPRAVVSLTTEQDGTASSNVVFNSIRIYKGRQHEDSDWISVTPYSNFNGTIQYRRRAGLLTIRLSGSPTAAINVGTDGNIADFDLFDLPVGFRTSGGGMTMTQPFSLSAADTNVMARISSSGTVYLVSADARNVAYTIGTSTVIQGMSPALMINS